MARFRIAAAALTVFGATVATGLMSSVRAQGSLFTTTEVDETKFVLVSAPIGSGERSQLNIYEQRTSARPCYSVTGSAPAVVDPLLATFDFTGICNRYLDSNGYSLRTSGKDVDKRFRLRLKQSRNGLALQAVDSMRGGGIMVARASKVRRDKNAFVKLTLEPGWSLERRSYKGRTLSHVYFANKKPMNTLIAASKARTFDRSLTFTANLPKPPSQPGGRRLNQQRGPVRLTVIPFRP